MDLTVGHKDSSARLTLSIDRQLCYASLSMGTPTSEPHSVQEPS